MTLVQLEYVVAVDTYRSFVAAAEKCFVTQPTLSMQIQKLEETLGVKLFDRSKQPVTPTEIGTRIIEQARMILQEGQKIKEIISDQQQELEGELKVGVIPTIAPYLLPKVILNFMHTYPKVKLVIWEETTEQIIQHLKTGLLDCGILATPLDDPQLNEIHVFYENFVTYVSKSSRLAKKKTVDVEELDTEDIWLLNEGHCLRNQVLNICQRRKPATTNAFEYNTGSMETLIRMVDLNNGITILPELSLSDFSVKQLNRVRYFRSPEPVREISIVTHRNFIKRRLIGALEEQILEAVPKKMKTKKKKDVVQINR